MMGRVGLILIAAATALPPGRLNAQQPDLVAVRDSLARITDAALLRQAALPRDAAGTRVILAGLSALRLFELTGEDDAMDSARQAFERARDIDPASPWALWGVGRSLVAADTADDQSTIVTGRAFSTALGLDPVSRARRAFRDALRIDPDFLPAAEALVPLAAAARAADDLAAARETLRRATSTLATGPRAWIALSLAERALGDLDAAGNAAALAVAALSGAPLPDAPPATVVHREQAIVRFLAGADEAGARAWDAALDAMTVESSDILFHDLRVLADNFDRETYEAADLASRRAWLRQFWTTRAALAGVTTAQRIAEHYRRMDHAQRHYARQRFFGAPPRNALLLERPEHPFDDRGLIYIRHGEPFRTIRTPDATRMQTESWVYRAPDGEFNMVHFANYGSAERAGTVVGDPSATGANGTLGEAYDEFILVYNLPCFGSFTGDRMLYDRSLIALTRCDPLEIRSVSATVRRYAREALRTDSDAPAFTRDLSFYYDLHTFRGNDGKTDLVAAIVVPGKELAPVRAAGGAAYGMDVSLIVVDTMYQRVTRLDTTLWLRVDRTLREDESLRAHVTLPVLPSTESIQRLIVREAGVPDHGQLYGRPIALPDYHRAGLRMSDIVLASPDSTGTWRRGDVSLSFVPTREFAGGAFRLFYEVYGLTADARYRTEVRIERTGGGIGRAISRLFGAGPAVRLRFEEDTPSGLDAVRAVRHVETELEPGRYDIVISLTDLSSGATAEQRREFNVGSR